jgi:hypothetical protein
MCAKHLLVVLHLPTLLSLHSTMLLCPLAGSEQHAWVLSDLAAVDRSVTPWVVVGGHRPMYIASTFKMPEWGDQTVASDLRAAFEDAFLAHRVRGRVSVWHCGELGCAIVVHGLCLWLMS